MSCGARVVAALTEKVDDHPPACQLWSNLYVKGLFMRAFDASKFTDEALLELDDMLTEAILKIEKIPSLAVALMADTLQELERRGKVKLISGSFDDIGNALIKRV